MSDGSGSEEEDSDEDFSESAVDSDEEDYSGDGLDSDESEGKDWSDLEAEAAEDDENASDDDRHGRSRGGGGGGSSSRHKHSSRDKYRYKTTAFSLQILKRTFHAVLSRHLLAELITISTGFYVKPPSPQGLQSLNIMLYLRVSCL